MIEFLFNAAAVFMIVVGTIVALVVTYDLITGRYKQFKKRDKE